MAQNGQAERQHRKDGDGDGGIVGAGQLLDHANAVDHDLRLRFLEQLAQARDLAGVHFLNKIDARQPGAQGIGGLGPTSGTEYVGWGAAASRRSTALPSMSLAPMTGNRRGP
jgi:hypothetical protein